MEDGRKRRLAKLLLGLSREEIDKIIEEQATLSLEMNRDKIERELQRLRSREQVLLKDVENIRQRISDVEAGKFVRSTRSRGNVSGKPLSDLVLEVVRGSSEPIRPRDIAAQITSQGLYDGDSRSLQTGIAITLKRLINIGKVTKANARYSVV
jgi:hypothetical protein